MVSNSLTTCPSTAAARAQSASGIPALVVTLSREIPSGTDGGRKHPTRTPSSSAAAWAARATWGEGIGTDSTPPSGAVTPSAPARAVARVWTSAGSSGRVISSSSAASAPAAAAGARPVS